MRRLCKRGFVLLTAMSFANYDVSPIRAAEEPVSLRQMTFVTSPKWYVLTGKARDGDVLVFRKYSFVLIDGDVSDTKNIFDFGCQRGRYNDYLVFHFPSRANLGFDRNSWNPHLRLNVALNNLSVTFDAEGEYKNDSIFIDFNEQQWQHLF